MDEFNRECLAIDVGKKLTSEHVLERLSDLFVHRGVPEHIRSDNGSEFTAKCVREWLGRVGVKTLFIEPGSPWENGYVESFNGKLRDELLEREAFDTLLEAKVLIERWRQHYNTVRPHSALGYRPPAPEARQPCAVASAKPRQPHRAGLLEGKTLTKKLASFMGAGQCTANCLHFAPRTGQTIDRKSFQGGRSSAAVDCLPAPLGLDSWLFSVEPQSRSELQCGLIGGAVEEIFRHVIFAP